MDLVSIITPLYNAEAYLEETAASIFAQSHTNWEWIIINDCSKDSSLSIAKSLEKKDSRIKVISNSINLRTALTRNRGLDHCSGRYIAFIDSDDLWHPKKLEKQISFMKRTGALLSCHAYKKFRGSIAHAGNTIPVPEKVSYFDLLRTNSISCLSAMYDASILGHVQMPDGYKAREDYLCWLSILKKIDYAYGYNEPLGYYRILNNSYSANKLEVAKLQWKVYREHEKLNLCYSAICFIFYSLHGFLKSKIA